MMRYVAVDILAGLFLRGVLGDSGSLRALQLSVVLTPSGAYAWLALQGRAQRSLEAPLIVDKQPKQRETHISPVFTACPRVVPPTAI